MDYKSYQHVVDLSGSKKSASKCKPKAAKTPGAIKKRTKSGCLACRGRKKKCDEDKVDGKCQACIRNFLDCCWPTEVKNVPVALKPASEPISEPTVSIIDKTTPKPTNGASAYPSPMPSPKLLSAEDRLIKSPVALTKVTKQSKAAPRKLALTGQFAQFVVTSFDKDRVLCQI